MKFTLKLNFPTLVCTLLTSQSLGQAQFLVTSLSDSAPGSLRDSISQANAAAIAATINFNIAGGGTVNLASMLPVLKNPNGISIDGANGGQGVITIDGGSTSSTTGDRVFFIGVSTDVSSVSPGLAATTATNWSIKNLTIKGGNARGGRGGSGAGGGGGGGGAGLGGAIFLNSGNLTLQNTSLIGNRSTGGNGGAGYTVSTSVNGLFAFGGGGGGLGGNGGRGETNSIFQSGGGGGGFGLSASGATSSVSAGAGSFLGAAAGGFTVQNGANPTGVDGGGGIMGIEDLRGFGLGGGVTGLRANVAFADPSGFGGGGGGGLMNAFGFMGTFTITGSGKGSPGGYGGGGGGGAAGGFGGGGGGGITGNSTAETGAGGFAASGGTPGTSGGGVNVPGAVTVTGKAGGGGAGLGAALFIRSGATVSLQNGAISGNTVMGGSGETGGVNGQGIGEGIFLAGSATYNVSAGTTVTISDTLGGGVNAEITGGFTKSGTGTLVLGGANSYTGNTIINAGTLAVSGSTGALAPVAVQVGGTLGGSGIVGGVATVSGTVNPGNSVGTLTVGGLSGSGLYLCETDAATSDNLIVTGEVDLTGMSFSLSGTDLFPAGTSRVILEKTSSGPSTGHFTGLPQNGLISRNSGQYLRINYVGGDGNDVMLTALTAADIKPVVTSFSVVPSSVTSGSPINVNVNFQGLPNQSGLRLETSTDLVNWTLFPNATTPQTWTTDDSGTVNVQTQVPATSLSMTPKRFFRVVTP